MTDKEFFRKEVEKLKSQLLRGACSSQIAMETRCKEEAYNEMLAILDTMQEEPVSEELEEAADNALSNVLNTHEIVNVRSCLDMFRFGAKWQKAKDESTTEDLGEYINKLSKQFPEVSFAKLSRIAVRVSKWQKEQMIAKAVDGYVIKDVEEGNGDFLLSADYLSKNMGLKDQQKVKVIVIKED